VSLKITLVQFLPHTVYATVCHLSIYPSVRPSVRPSIYQSVTFKYRDHRLEYFENNFKAE